MRQLLLALFAAIILIGGGISVASNTEVAKTYLTWERVGEPFEEKGNYYIYVINPKNDKEKKVRWYGEAPGAFTAKKLFGFDKGYITIFKGVNRDNEDYFRQSCARLAMFFGWYLVSSEEFSSPLPANVEPIKLYWEEITENDKLLDSNDIKRLVKQKIGNIFYT